MSNEKLYKITKVNPWSQARIGYLQFYLCGGNLSKISNIEKFKKGSTS